MKNFLFYYPRSIRFGSGLQEWQRITSKVLSKYFDVRVMCGDVCNLPRWTFEEAKEKFSHCSVIEEVGYWKFNLPFSQRHLDAHWYLPNLRYWLRIARAVCWADVIYFNHFYPPHDPLPKILAYLLRKKTIYGFHSAVKPKGVLSQWSVRRAKAAHTINTNFYRWLSRFSPKNTFYIPDFLLSDEIGKGMRANIKGHFVFAGRYDGQKQIQLLTDSVRHVLERDKSICFDFYGSGPLDIEIQKLKKDYPESVVNHGYEFDKNKIYDEKKFFILVSKDEPFGLVVIESMIRGIPVISTDTFGPRDIISDGEDGFIVRTNKPEDIARKIVEANSLDEKTYRQMSTKAKEKVLTKYTELQFERDLKKMIESV